MSRGLGKIERAIVRAIEVNRDAGHPAHVSSWAITLDVFEPKPEAPGWRWMWNPTRSQRASVVHAMRTFVRKFPCYDLAGGQGRKPLLLYEPSDPLGGMWAQLFTETPGTPSLAGARRALDAARAVTMTRA